MIIRGTFLESSLDPGWIHFISATILREISGDSPKIFTFPLGKDFLNDTNLNLTTRGSAHGRRVRWETHRRHPERRWHHRLEWSDVKQATLRQNIRCITDMKTDTRPWGRSNIQSVCPMCLSTPPPGSNSKGANGASGPIWDVPSTCNLDIECRINANQNQQPFTTHTKLIWLALSEGQSTFQNLFLAISCRRIFTGNGACCWSNSKFLWSLFLSYVFSQLQTAGGDSRGGFPGGMWIGGFWNPTQVVHLIQGIFL